MGNQVDVDLLRQELINDEGIRYKPYKDSAIPPRLTIGVGRNLDDKGLSGDEIQFLLANDIEEVEKDLQTFPWWSSLDSVRQVALANMRFQLGPNRFRGFKNMLAAVSVGNFDEAAKQTLDSDYAKQVPRRAAKVAYQLRTGKV